MKSNGFSKLSQNDEFNEPSYSSGSDEIVNYNKSKMDPFKLFVVKRQRPLIPDLNTMELSCYISPSNIILKYLDLLDSILELLQLIPPKEIIEALNCVMASDTQGINMFSAEFISKLKNFFDITSVFRVLFPYTNWYDHSIIRELLEVCDCTEGIKLLDKFDSQINITLPITSYPIPAPSDLMVSDESSTHTVMAVRCEQQLSGLSLQYIGVVKLLIMETFRITKHACVVLAVADHSSAMLFWLIPKGVVSLISNAVQKHSTYLYRNGLLEVAIYPNFSFSTGSTSRIWMMAYHSDTTAMLKHVRC